MMAYKLCVCGKKIEAHLRSCEACACVTRKLTHQSYDMFKRDLDSARFYNSTAWRKLRAAFLNENPFCVKCGRFAKIIDHIVPIKQGGAKLERDNLQSLCMICHNEKTKSEQKGVRGSNLYRGETSTPSGQF